MPSGDALRVLITTEFYLPFQCGVTTAVLNEIKALEVLGDEVRVHTLLGIKRVDVLSASNYIRILAFDERGSSYLKQVKKSGNDPVEQLKLNHFV